MDKQMSAGAVRSFSAANADLHLGQYVRILRGEHRGVSGSVIACEYDASRKEWVYFVKNNRVEYGPYTTKELW